jgi:4-hydroxy-4-methyl-2-oxoglutarate aldolase
MSSKREARRRTKARTRAGLSGIIPPDRIRTLRIRRPSRASIEAFRELADLAGLVARALDRLGVVGAIPAEAIGPLRPGQRAVGPAITVRNVPDRLAPYRKWREREPSWLGEREAYFVARPGDVIVIDGGGRMSASNMGGQSARAALGRGLAGSIVDGPITGVAKIVASKFPVWTRGVTTLTGHHRVETIEINGIVCCGGVQVCPGDLVVADDQGVAIVPFDLVGEVLRICRAQARIAGAARADRGGDPARRMKEFMRRVSRR